MLVGIYPKNAPAFTALSLKVNVMLHFTNNVVENRTDHHFINFCTFHHIQFGMFCLGFLPKYIIIIIIHFLGAYISIKMFKFAMHDFVCEKFRYKKYVVKIFVWKVNHIIYLNIWFIIFMFKNSRQFTSPWINSK